VAGLDHDDDARGAAVVDWDHDGHLDVWMVGRTGPRIRFLQNRGLWRDNHYLALRLVGTRSNRDAIGARVELYRPGQESPQQLRTLRAGEGFLAQSSKWIHFGLGDDAAIDRIVVRWPGGEAQTFRGFAADRRYVLTQEITQPRPWQSPRGPVSLAQTPLPSVEIPAAKRLLAARRLPMPRLTLADYAGTAISVSDDGSAATHGPLLINLWSLTCRPCLEELRAMALRRDELAAVGLTVLPINVDAAAPGAAANPSAEDVLRRLGVAPTGGVADGRLLDTLDVVRRTLTNQEGAMPVPCSFLLDGRRRLVALYSGPVLVDQLLADARLAAASPQDERTAAIPFPGRWYTNAFPPDVLAIPERLALMGRADDALDYVQQHAGLITGSDAALAASSRQWLAGRLVGLYQQLAAHFGTSGDLDRAAALLERALAAAPDDLPTNLALASLRLQQGRTAEAIERHRHLLALRGGDPVLANNLAWLLATWPDATGADAAEAVRLARQACERTGNRLPSTFDTLAAAHAAAGDFDRALTAADRAIELFTLAGQRERAEQVKARRALYEARQPYREAAGAGS